MQFQFIRGHNQKLHKEALIAGFRRHDALGLLPRAMACWGWRNGKRFARNDVLICERGYIGDRFYWTSIGFNGLNGRAEFPEYPDDGGKRFERIGVPLKPWNPTGDSVLLVGQVRGDMSLRGKNLVPWYAETAKRCQEVYGLPVRFRPHPMEVRRGRATSVAGFETDKGELSESIERAAVVVTWNSNTGVESMLAGKPTVCHDIGSMAYEVAAHGIGEVCTGEGREQWAHRLAWKQWTLDEIRSGDALEGVVRWMRGRAGRIKRDTEKDAQAKRQAREKRLASRPDKRGQANSSEGSAECPAN